MFVILILGMFNLMLGSYHIGMIINSNRKAQRTHEQLATRYDTLYELEKMEYLRVPLTGPTFAELENNPALRLAWDEFSIIYKLTVQ